MAHDESQILELVKLHLELMRRITNALEQLAGDHSVKAPNYQIPLESWSTFDWQFIGAVVERRDNHGAAIVSWRGQIFTRRSPDNKFGAAIFFSRCIGKDERGENQYERLVTFKPLPQVEPVPQRVSRLIR